MLWIRRAVGDEIFNEVEDNNWDWHLVRTPSMGIPGDIYCDCGIYVSVPHSKEGTIFSLKYSSKEEL